MKTGKKHASLSKKQAEALLEEIIKQGAMQVREQQKQHEEQLPALSAEDYAYLRGRMDVQIKQQQRRRRLTVRTILVAAVLICAMAAVTIGGGALNEYINRILPEYDSKGVDVNIEKENIIGTFDGRPVEEHYSDVLHTIPGFDLVVPAKLPQDTFLEFLETNSDNTHIRMKYAFKEGTLTFREYCAGDDTFAVEYKVLENNKVETSHVTVMDYPADYMEIVLESGDVRYVVVWTNQAGESYYIEFSGDKSTFNMILDGLKIFEEK